MFFFFNDTATTEIYTLSLHDALPICAGKCVGAVQKCSIRNQHVNVGPTNGKRRIRSIFEIRVCYNHPVHMHTRISKMEDRKSTRLNSSHGYISYAVFCLKKKKTSNHNSQLGKDCNKVAVGDNHKQYKSTHGFELSYELSHDSSDVHQPHTLSVNTHADHM